MNSKIVSHRSRAGRVILLISLVLVTLGSSSAVSACADELDSLSPNALHGVQVEQLAWLSGLWRSGDQHNGSWQQLGCPQGGMMLGWQQDLRDGETRFFEFQRYHNSGDGVIFLAQPRGQPGTGFVLMELSDQQAVFENVLHDFPQRIQYRVESAAGGDSPDQPGKRLTATISGVVEGEQRSSSWQWNYQGPSADCPPAQR